MTVSELRTLVDNLDEYIHIPGGIDRLKKMVLHLAVSGQLVPQDPSEGTGEELYRQIQAKKVELIKQGKIKKQKNLLEIGDNEEPFLIPESWKWVRFGALGDFGSGSTPVRGEARYYDGEINWFKSGELNDSYVTTDSEEKITEEALAECSLRLNKPGDLLIAMYGATAGRLGLLQVEGTTNQAVCGVTLADGVDRLFTFNSLLATRHLLIEQSSGAAQPNISKVKIVNMTFPLPPLAEQKRIVAKVDNIFALIDQLAEVYKSEQAERSKLVASSLAQLAKGEDGVEGSLALTNLSEIIRTKADAKILRQTILHLAVSGQLVPQDLSEGTGEELYQKIQSEKAELVKQGKLRKQKILPEISDDEMPFEVPHTWRWARLGSVGLTQTGGTPSKNNPEYFGSDVPFIKPGDITQTSVNYSNEGLSSLGASKLDRVAEAGSILMVCIGTIGKCQIINRASSFNQQINSVTPYAQIHEYLYIAMQAQYFLALAWQKSSSTTIAILNKGKWESIPVPLPSLAEQKRIVAKTTQLLNLVSELEKHLEK